MDVEKTMQFIVEHQAAFAAGMEELKASMGELRDMQRKTDERINKLNSATDERINHLTSVVASLVTTAQAHQASLDAFDMKWKDFLARFDAWLRGQGGNGQS